MKAITNPLLSSVLRLFFFLIYNPLAWTYDWVSILVSLGQWQNWILSVLPYLSGKQILELGFGPGHLQIAINNRGYQAFGIDLSQSMVRLTRRRLFRSSFPIRLVRGKAQVLPFCSDVFDQVVSTFPTEYIFQPETLGEIRRILTPGGNLVVLPVAWIGHRSWIERSLRWIYHATHQAPLQEDESWRLNLTVLFQEAGFEVYTEMISVSSSDVFIVLATKPKVK